MAELIWGERNGISFTVFGGGAVKPHMVAAEHLSLGSDNPSAHVIAAELQSIVVTFAKQQKASAQALVHTSSASHRDTMPKRAFTNDERHGGRGSGADNIDYRSRQAFDREEASHRGNPGRQQAAPGPEEDPRGFTRGPAPAETKTYGDWGRPSSDLPLMLGCGGTWLTSSWGTVYQACWGGSAISVSLTSLRCRCSRAQGSRGGIRLGPGTRQGRCRHRRR